MAYVDRSTPRHRGPILASIAVIHVAVVYAVASGLTVVLPPIFERGPVKTFHVPLPSPVPDTPDKPVKPGATKQASSVQPRAGTATTVTVSNTASSVDVDDKNLWGELPELTVLPTATPSPAPTPLFTPKLARPRSAPGLWVTADDYPAADLRAEREGITRFILLIGTDGRVMGCEIIASSGSPSLDAAACTKLKQRARFSPATDATGATVPGTYASAVKWTIPKN